MLTHSICMFIRSAFYICMAICMLIQDSQTLVNVWKNCQFQKEDGSSLLPPTTIKDKRNELAFWS